MLNYINNTRILNKFTLVLSKDSKSSNRNIDLLIKPVLVSNHKGINNMIGYANNIFTSKGILSLSIAYKCSSKK